MEERVVCGECRQVGHHDEFRTEVYGVSRAAYRLADIAGNYEDQVSTIGSNLCPTCTPCARANN